jgi:hypothetical protein
MVPDSNTLMSLTGLLVDQDERIRFLTSTTLSKAARNNIDISFAESALLHALNDEDGMVRFCACKALVRLYLHNVNIEGIDEMFRNGSEETKEHVAGYLTDVTTNTWRYSAMFALRAASKTEKNETVGGKISEILDNNSFSNLLDTLRIQVEQMGKKIQNGRKNEERKPKAPRMKN